MSRFMKPSSMWISISFFVRSVLAASSFNRFCSSFWRFRDLFLKTIINLILSIYCKLQSGIICYVSDLVVILANRPSSPVIIFRRCSFSSRSFRNHTRITLAGVSLPDRYFVQKVHYSRKYGIFHFFWFSLAPVPTSTSTTKPIIDP